MKQSEDSAEVSTLRLQVHRAVVSESRFPNKTGLDNLAKHLRSIKAIGQLTINFSQGSVTGISFVARKKLNGHDHVELKFEGD